MGRRTLILDLIAMLTLLAMANGRTIMGAQDVMETVQDVRQTNNEVQTQEFNLTLEQEKNVDGITLAIVGSMIILITLITIFRKLHQMSDISVKLPDFNIEDNLTNIIAQQ